MNDKEFCQRLGIPYTPPATAKAPEPTRTVSNECSRASCTNLNRTHRGFCSPSCYRKSLVENLSKSKTKSTEKKKAAR